MQKPYNIINQKECYFITLQVVDWVDVFTRREYCQIVIDSLKYCRENKGLFIWSYVIMSNHIHLILSSKTFDLSDIIRDFKSFTARTILDLIQGPKESRRKWMLKRFEFYAKKNSRSSKYQFWKNENRAIEIYSEKFFRQKMAYIHLNPVRAGLVYNPEDYVYSSQRNYNNLNYELEIDLADI